MVVGRAFKPRVITLNSLSVFRAAGRIALCPRDAHVRFIHSSGRADPIADVGDANVRVVGSEAGGPREAGQAEAPGCAPITTPVPACTGEKRAAQVRRGRTLHPHDHMLRPRPGATLGVP
jgi:hypothetical protein